MDFGGRGKNLSKPRNPKTVCPDCKLKIKSVMAQRCMDCHIEYVNRFHPRNKMSRERLKKRMKEIIEEERLSKAEKLEMQENGVPEI